MRKPIISEKMQKIEIWRIFLGTNDLELYRVDLGEGEEGIQSLKLPKRVSERIFKLCIPL